MSAAHAARRVLDMAGIVRAARRRVVLRASGRGSSERRIVQTITLPGVNSRLEKYAQLVVRTGINVRAGQLVLVEADVEHTPLVRAIAEEAYAAGARYVDVSYTDRWVQRAFVMAAPEEMLGWTPPWMVQRLERAIEVGAAVIGE